MWANQTKNLWSSVRPIVFKTMHEETIEMIEKEICVMENDWIKERTCSIKQERYLSLRWYHRNI